MCQQLWCEIEGEALCRSKLNPPATGTTCATGKVRLVLFDFVELMYTRVCDNFFIITVEMRVIMRGELVAKHDGLENQRSFDFTS